MNLKSLIAFIFNMFRSRDDLPLLDEVLEEGARLRATWGDNPEQWDGVLVCKDDDNDDDDSDDDDKDDDDDDDSDDDDNDDDNDDDDDDDDDKETPEQKENRELKRRLGEERRARKKAEKAAKTNERKRSEKSGQHKRMYEEEKERADGLEAQLKAGSLERAVIAEATRLEFINPSNAFRLVSPDLSDAVDEDGEVDEDRVRDSLKKLAKSDKHLVNKKKRQGNVKGDDDDDDDDSDDDKDDKSKGGGGSDDDISPQERMRRSYEKSEKDRKKREGRG